MRTAHLIETDSLEELAAEGKRLPVERLKQLESQLPLTHEPDHDTGVFDAPRLRHEPTRRK